MVPLEALPLHSICLELLQLASVGNEDQAQLLPNQRANAIVSDRNKCCDGPRGPRAWFQFLKFVCVCRPIFNCFVSSGKTSIWADSLCSVSYEVLRECKYCHCYLFYPLVFCLSPDWFMMTNVKILFHYLSWAKR